MSRRSIFDRIMRPSIYLAATALGLVSLIYPFLLPLTQQSTSTGSARTTEMPLLLTLLLGLCLIVLIYESQGRSFNTKMIALLGILVAINAALRFVEVGIPGPGGFSPIFFLIILTGYVFGGRFGFLMGTLTLLVSSILTGGVGPWLPSQMFAAGWVGMSAALLSPIIKRTKNMFPSIGHKTKNRFELFILVVFGFMWGMLYGLIMNLWSWPYFSGPAGESWSYGIGFIETIYRYLSYYAVTSLIWDLGRAVGTALVLLAFGIPTIRALRRFHSRFTFSSPAFESRKSSDAILQQEEVSLEAEGNA